MAKIDRLDIITKKLQRMPLEAKKTLGAAAEKNRDEFYAKVQTVVPVSEDAPHLKNTLVKEPGRHELEFGVAIGGPEAPYPAHLEFGHIAKDGMTQVPAEPFWYPTRRILRKRFKSRNSRAVSQAVKAFGS